MNRIEFVDEQGKVIALGSGPALAKSLAGEAPLLIKPIIMVGEDGKVTHAGFSGNPAGLVKSQAIAEAIRAMPAPKKAAPAKSSPSMIKALPAYATKAQMEKSQARDRLRQGALDVMEHRLLVTYRGQSVPASHQTDGPFAKAFMKDGRDVPDAARYADYLLSVSEGISDFKERCNQGTRAAGWA